MRTKDILNSPEMRARAGRFFARYFRFVYKSSRSEDDFPKIMAPLNHTLPAIFTFWHGEQFLIPPIIEGHFKAGILVSRNKDGDIQAAAIEAYGLPVVRGSGGRDRHKKDKGAVAASLGLLDLLKNGMSVGMTANVPRGPAREVGKGVVTLAKLSGCPVYPICHVTRARIKLNSWDRAVINLPFSRAAFEIGQPVYVESDADNEAVETARVTLQNELERINAKARGRVGLGIDEVGG